MPGKMARYVPPTAIAVPKPASCRFDEARYHRSEWKELRLRVLLRDAYACQSCGRVVTGVTAHVDHRVPAVDGGSDAEDNLQVLCRVCHGRKTRDEQRRHGFLP